MANTKRTQNRAPEIRQPATTIPPHKEAELAEHIAAILSNVYTPAELYNAMVDALADLHSEIPARESCDTPEAIERVLNWHQGFGFRNVTEAERSRQ